MMDRETLTNHLKGYGPVEKPKIKSEDYIALLEVKLTATDTDTNVPFHWAPPAPVDYHALDGLCRHYANMGGGIEVYLYRTADEGEFCGRWVRYVVSLAALKEVYGGLVQLDKGVRLVMTK